MKNLKVFRINKKSDVSRIEKFGEIEELGNLPETYEEFLTLTGILRQEGLNKFFLFSQQENRSPFFTPKWISHAPTFVIGETFAEAERREKLFFENYHKKEAEREIRAEKSYQESLEKMYQPAKGWYIVTLNLLVSKIKGNDGEKVYSFKILADNEMDAYEKACKIVNEKGVVDKNVSFVYEILDSPVRALIEFVGMWTDEAALEYGETV